jgi:hypothetical protein
MIEELKKITEKLICINKDNADELRKYIIIQKILKKGDCFLNMDIEYAYSILRDLKIPDEQIRKIYLELI